MTPIDIEWYDAHPYPPPGWRLALVWGRVQFEDGDFDCVVVASRGEDRVVWSQMLGVAMMLGDAYEENPCVVETDPCITETLRLYALGLRRPVAEEGER